MLIYNLLCCFVTRVVCARITVTWGKGIQMRVSLFVLFLRGTNLIEPWPKPVRSVLLVIGFIQFYQFYVSLGDIWCCPIYFTSRLFTCSYPTIPCVFSSGCHLLYLFCSCMHVLTPRFSMHVYALDLSIHMCLSMHATWHSHHHLLGSFDFPGSSCPGLEAWSLWIS